MIHRSPYPDVEIPDVDLCSFVLGPAPARGDRPALVDGVTGATLTYAGLSDQVSRTAAGLHRDGFRRGEVALVCAPNRLEFPVAFLAVARLGGATTTMNPGFTADEMRAQLDDARPAVAFTTPELAGRVRAAAGPGLRRLYTFGEAASAAPFGELAGADEPPQVEIAPARDVVALPYSSGTTGRPKGVMLTHRNLVAMQLLMGPVEGSGEGDVTLAALPFFHIYGLSVILTLGLYRGATLVVFPRFDMESCLAAIERHRITRLPLVPPLVLRLAREPRLEAFDVGTVRTVISGAAPLAPELASALSARLGCLVKQGYGLTELSPGSHMHPEDGEMPAPGSVGVLHPNTEMRLVDPATLADVPDGGTGEVWIRGPQVMLGYLGRPEETAAMITPEGWLRTGDLGRVDERGNLYVVDRLKELIKYKGFQVAPAELEAVLLTHPAVADAAVVARPDPEAGELPKAFVVRVPGVDAGAAELMDFVAGRVAGYKRVRELEFLDEIPKSPSGKILRRLLMAPRPGA